ncbi:MAG: hypothetical protein JXB46_02175, partial [Candidatus Eisenbacteria bacterium]|nr:hypothetical protein [Candidatus Eisenbacteria bacterium]
MSRRGSALGAAIAALFVLLATIPAAGETDVDYAGVVREKYLYNTDPAIDASVSDTRIELDIGIGELTIGAVYRAYLLSNDGYNPAGVTGDPIRIKHRYIALVHDDILLRAGHFFETFGHGLTLRSFEDVDLEYDTALDGLLADYSAGHVVPFLGDVSVTALTGTATHDVPGTAYYDYVVNAARVAMPVSEYGEIAGSVVERSETQKDEEVSLPDDAAKSKDAVVGYELSVWMGPLALAGEYASRHSNGETSGHALYGSGTLDLGWVTLFGELKDYEDYDYYMVNPPTAVRDHLWTLMNRATYEIDLNDERGFLIEGSAPVGDAAYLLG